MIKDYTSIINKAIQDVVLQEGPLSLLALNDKVNLVVVNRGVEIERAIVDNLRLGFLVVVESNKEGSILDLASQAELRS